MRALTNASPSLKYLRFLNNQNGLVEASILQKVITCIIDLVGLKRKGDFNCPKCGIAISPDDMTDRTFSVLDTVMRGGHLEKIILKCNKCGSQIHITGFHLLAKMISSD